MFVQGCIGRVAIVKQKHVDEVDEDARGALGHADIEVAPFENDHENQVSKQTQDKNHLRDKLQNDVESFSEVSGGGKHTHVQDRALRKYSVATYFPQDTKCSFFEHFEHL